MSEDNIVELVKPTLDTLPPDPPGGSISELHKDLLLEVMDELAADQEAAPVLRNIHEGAAKLAAEAEVLWDLVRLQPHLRPPSRISDACSRIAAAAIRIRYDLEDGGYRQL